MPERNYEEGGGPRWWPFQRGFLRAGTLLFPGSGGFQGPVQVRDDVQIVEQLYRCSVAHDIRFSSETLAAATGGATTALDHPEPSSGYFHIPIIWAVSYDGAAAIQIEGLMLATASATDPWGRYATSDLTFTTARTSNNRVVNLTAFPYMRGHRLRARFVVPAAATNVNSIFVFIECPVETATLDNWRSMFGNYMHNSPVP